MAERTKFMYMKQEIDEPIIEYHTVYEMRVDIASLENLDHNNRRLKRT